MTRKAAHVVTLASLLSAASMTLAAPAQSEDINPSGNNVGGRAPESGTARAAPTPVTGTGSGKAVDLLLQLQDKPQLYERGGEGAAAVGSRRAADPAARREDAVATAPLPSSLSDLKKSVVSGQAPAQAEAPRQPDLPEANQSATASTGHAGPGPVPIVEGEPSTRLSANPIFRFIRENRGLLVLAAGGIAIALWLTATVSFRRSR